MYCVYIYVTEIKNLRLVLNDVVRSRLSVYCCIYLVIQPNQPQQEMDILLDFPADAAVGASQIMYDL